MPVWVRYVNIELMNSVLTSTQANINFNSNSDQIASQTNGNGNLQSYTSQFKVGSRVRVRPNVKNPHFKWGSVTPDSVGVVVCE